MSNSILNIVNHDGTIDTLIADSRPKQIGVHSIKILTDGVYRLISDSVYKQQKVQSIMYDKYQLSFIATESYGVELLDNAKSITLSAHNGTVIHDCDILDIQTELQSNTDFLLVRIEYFDKNLNNYRFAEPPVTNFLRSDALRERNPITDLNYIAVHYKLREATFATLIDFAQTAAQPEESTFVQTQTGAKVTTNSIIKNQYELIIYLNSEDIIPFQELLPLADFTNVTCWYFNQGVPYQIQETPIVSVEATQGSDLWKCSCTFVSSIINNYSYQT